MIGDMFSIKASKIWHPIKVVYRNTSISLAKTNLKGHILCITAGYGHLLWPIEF